MSFLDRFKTLFASDRLDVRARFDLMREAISGSMSKFYMARDRNTDEVLGLKILDAEKTALFENRFKAIKKPSEGEIAVQLNHPYIVKTIEHGLTTTGDKYLLMEYLGGHGLNWMIGSRDTSKLDGRRVRFLRQVAEALGAVHEAGFIHRDVCPRNLIFTEDCETLKLTDFGLSVPDEPAFRQPGNRTGTADYMAPELVRRQSTDLRLDVFAFGVTAFEMCTGQLPFPSGRGGGMAALSHGTTIPDMREIRPTIHPDLAEAITSCLQAAPSERCPSMADFLAAIRNVEREDVQ
jgi:serine/threonine-protein kinase